MLRIFLRDAWRHLRGDSSFIVISISGLALGLTACIFISLFIANELSYDRFNVNADRIYRIASDIHINGGTTNNIVTPSPMAAALGRDFPAVETAVRIRALREGVIVHVGNKEFAEQGAVLADPTIFGVFTLPMVAGNPKSALSSPNSLVVSEEAARQYFHSTDVLGQALRLDNDTAVYVVTGVIRDMPAESHFHFRLIKPMIQRRQDWINLYASTYILVRPGVTTADVDRMLAETVDKYVDPQIQKDLHSSAADLKRNGDYFRYYAMPLTHIHLYSNLGLEFEPNGSIEYVVLFTVVALLIIGMANVNFINLSVARGMRRLREMGVRKVLGSNRRQLVQQFLVESVLVTLIAMGLAIGLVLLLLPVFNQLTGKAFSASLVLSPKVIGSCLLVTLGVAILAGIYPALQLSGVQPLNILRGYTGLGFRKEASRTALLIFEFSVAMILIIGTIVIHSQLSYIRHRDLGYTREQVMTIKGTRSMDGQVWAFVDAVRQLPGVTSVSVSGNLPQQKVVYRGFFKDRTQTETSTVLLGDFHIDDQYLPTLGMKLTMGRNFSSQLPTDSRCVLINETAARALGYVHPMGRQLYTYGDSAGLRIIGVVRDFNTGSLHNPIDPVVFELRRDGGGIIIRLSLGDVRGTLRDIERQFRAIANGFPFDYTFLDDDFNRLYRADQRTGDLFSIFSGLAIVIAAIGMFGLVAAAAEQRTKEMGIRRVLGVGVIDILLLFFKSYAFALCIAVLLALPVGALVMKRWLEGFAYRTSLQAWMFLFAPFCAFVLVLLIVGAKAWRATRVTPARTLRAE